MDARSALSLSDSEQDDDIEVSSTLLKDVLSDINKSIQDQYVKCPDNQKTQFVAESYLAYYYLWRSLLNLSVALPLTRYRSEYLTASDYHEDKNTSYTALVGMSAAELTQFHQLCDRFELLKCLPFLENFQSELTAYFDSHLNLKNQKIGALVNKLRMMLNVSFLRMNGFFYSPGKDTDYLKRITHSILVMDLAFRFEYKARRFVLKSIQHQTDYNKNVGELYEKFFKDESGIPHYEYFKRADVMDQLLAMMRRGGHKAEKFKVEFLDCVERYKKLEDKLLDNADQKKYYKALMAELTALKGQYFSRGKYFEEIEGYIYSLVSSEEMTLDEKTPLFLYKTALAKMYHKRLQPDAVWRHRGETVIARKISNDIADVLDELSAPNTLRGEEKEKKAMPTLMRKNAGQVEKRERGASRSQSTSSNSSDPSRAEPGEGTAMLRSRAPVIEPKRGRARSVLKGLGIGLAVTAGVTAIILFVFLSHGAGLALAGVFTAAAKALGGSGVAWGVLGGVMALPPFSGIVAGYLRWRNKAKVLLTPRALPAPVPMPESVLTPTSVAAPLQQTTTVILKATAQQPSSDTLKKSKSASTSGSCATEEEPTVPGYEYGKEKPQGLPSDLTAVTAASEQESVKRTDPLSQQKTRFTSNGSIVYLKQNISPLFKGVVREKKKSPSLAGVIRRLFACGS